MDTPITVKRHSFPPSATSGPATASWTPTRQASHVDTLLEAIDACRGQSGALSISRKGRPRGTVLVQHGRICWAMAEGMQARLTDLLRREAQTPVNLDFERFFKRCAAEDTPIGEALVREGWLTPNGLCQALRAHTAEAILLMSGQSHLQTRWFPHRKNDYDARFTFGPWEMLIDVGARIFPAEAKRATRGLAAVPQGSIAFAFVRRSGRAQPTPIAMIEEAGSEEIDPRPVGTWAAAFLDLVGYIDATSSLVAAVTPRGENAIAWREDDLIYVAICSDPRAMARLIRAHRRQSP